MVGVHTGLFECLFVCTWHCPGWTSRTQIHASSSMAKAGWPMGATKMLPSNGGKKGIPFIEAFIKASLWLYISPLFRIMYIIICTVIKNLGWNILEQTCKLDCSSHFFSSNFTPKIFPQTFFVWIHDLTYRHWKTRRSGRFWSLRCGEPTGGSRLFWCRASSGAPGLSFGWMGGKKSFFFIFLDIFFLNHGWTKNKLGPSPPPKKKKGYNKINILGLLESLLQRGVSSMHF